MIENKAETMLNELEQSAILVLLKKDISITLPVSKLTEGIAVPFTLNTLGITLSGDSLNEHIKVSDPLNDVYGLNEVGLSNAIADIHKWLVEFEGSIS